MFEEGSIALYFKTASGFYQAVNNNCPFYFIDPSQKFNSDDMLIAGKIKAIKENKQMNQILQLPKEKSVFCCTIDIVFKTSLKK